MTSKRQASISTGTVGDPSDPYADVQLGETWIAFSLDAGDILVAMSGHEPDRHAEPDDVRRLAAELLRIADAAGPRTCACGEEVEDVDDDEERPADTCRGCWERCPACDGTGDGWPASSCSACRGSGVRR